MSRKFFAVVVVALSATLLLAGCQNSIPKPESTPVSTSTCEPGFSRLPGDGHILEVPSVSHLTIVEASNAISLGIDPPGDEASFQFLVTHYEVLGDQEIKLRVEERNLVVTLYRGTNEVCYKLVD